MIRRSFVLLALSASIACASRTPEPTAASPSADAFAGAWRSVTPSLEFVRLSIASTSSEQGVLAARLTLSGVAMEGRGRIAGDSVEFAMTAAGTSQATGVLVTRVRDGATLAARLQPPAISSVSPLELSLVRD